MMWWGDSYMFGGWWMLVAMGIVWLAILATIIAVLVYATSQWRKDNAHPATGRASATPSAAEPGARAILDERYARGDISTEEYRERVTNLAS